MSVDLSMTITAAVPRPDFRFFRVSKSIDRSLHWDAGKTGTESASRDGIRKGGEGPSTTDQHRTAYEDDDIVARQLREAAENETDPELKAKLWKEYEEYKKSK